MSGKVNNGFIYLFIYVCFGKKKRKKKREVSGLAGKNVAWFSALGCLCSVGCWQWDRAGVCLSRDRVPGLLLRASDGAIHIIATPRVTVNFLLLIMYGVIIEKI